jgi:hypothetical protein
MKTVPSLISTGTAVLCLVLGIWLFVLGGKSQGLQTELQKLQQEVQNQQQVLQAKQQQLQVQKATIDRGATISQQVGPALLRDMATLSLKNEKLKNLLAKHGYNVEVKPEEPKKENP